MPAPDPFADRSEFPLLGGDWSLALARHQIVVSLLSFAVPHIHVMWERVSEGASSLALPLGIRVTAFAGFSICAFYGQSWSIRTIRLSLFLGIISVLKHAWFGAPPYAWMLATGLVYPFWTYFRSADVEGLLCRQPQRHRPSWWKRLARWSESGVNLGDVMLRLQHRCHPVLSRVRGLLASAP